MILVLLGTHEQPFERAIDLVLGARLDDDLIIQHGHTHPRHESERVVWREFAPYEEIMELCESASAIVCHAGVGTIMTALAAGTTPVVIPRLAVHGEHVDDHQLQIARAFGSEGRVIVLEDGADLSHALTQAQTGTRYEPRNERLRQAVAAAVDA